MEFEKPTFLAVETVNFLEQFSNAYITEKNLKKDNDKTVSTALFYEKIRVALEYQEEHLIFKNALARILRRKYMLSPNIESGALVADLINEMAWANYLNPETLNPADIAKIQQETERYFIILKYARSGHFSRPDLQKMVMDWLACAIDEILRPQKENDFLLDYAFLILNKNLDLKNTRITPEENEIQLKIAIYNLLLKPDFPLIQYWVLQAVYPKWSENSTEEMKKISRSFDPYYNKVDRALNHPLRKNYLSFAKRYIAPFVLLRSVLMTQNLDLDKLKTKPALLFDLMMNEYDTLIERGRSRVWRATIRALIFILITKISIAFFLEIPFDRLTVGAVNYLTLAINVSLPPLLMFIAGTFVKSPPKKNYLSVASSVAGILASDKIEDKPYLLLKSKKNSSYSVFNSIYTLFSLAILALVVWLLIRLQFNVVSITLFFFFVSVVSFFSFRIRNIALELAMKRSKDDALTSVVELLFMPFIRIGRAISDRFATFNPVILFLDFIIEAPMKTIIKILNAWFKFVNAKKEELEF